MHGDGEPTQPNLYRRGAIWYGRIWISGREIRWSLRTGDEEVARRRLKEERQRIEAAAAEAADPSRVKWGSAVEAWADHIVGNVGPKTITRYIVSLKQVAPFLNHLYVKEISRKTLATLIKERRAAGATNATVKRDLTAVSSVIDYAIEHEWMDDNPTLGARRRLKELRDPIVLPDRHSVETAIALAPGNMAHLIFAAWKTGCRQDELVTVPRRNLDHARRQLTIRGKRNKQRVISLDDETYERLARIPCAIGSPLLFYHSGGEPYRSMASRWRELMLRCVKAATGTGTSTPFRRFRFHDLRHLHAVEYLKDGGGLYNLSKRLGHTSVKTTEIYLAFLTPEEEAKAKAGRRGAPAHSPDHSNGLIESL